MSAPVSLAGKINLYGHLPYQLIKNALYGDEELNYIYDARGWQVVATTLGYLTLEPVHIGVLKRTPTNLLAATVTDAGGATTLVPAENLLVAPTDL